MASKTLRELAKQYAKGDIPQDAYRKLRTALIESILAGDVSPPVNEYRKAVAPGPAEPQEVTERRRERKRQPAPDTTAIVRPEDRRPAAPRKPAPPAFPLLKVSIGVAGVLIVAGIALLFTNKGEDEDSSPPPAPITDTQSDAAPVMESGSNGAMEDTGSVAATDLIREFLRSKNWSDTRLSEFVSQWEGLPAEDRAAASESVALGQLTNAIYKKLLEERALSALGDEQEAFEKQRKLAAFAEQIGISDPRISLPNSPDTAPNGNGDEPVELQEGSDGASSSSDSPPVSPDLIARSNA